MDCDSCSKNKKCNVFDLSRFTRVDYRKDCPCKECVLLISCSDDCEEYSNVLTLPNEEYLSRLNGTIKENKNAKRT